jgi:acyl carrier protein
MTDQFGRGLAGILCVSPNSVEPGLELNEDNWDSMAVISAIALIDESFGITVPVERLARCGNVGDLLALVNSMLPNSPGAGN